MLRAEWRPWFGRRVEVREAAVERVWTYPPNVLRVTRETARTSRVNGKQADTLEGRLRPMPFPKGARKQENSGRLSDALLAKLVEHSNGKAVVVSSILTEGSTKWSGKPVRVPEASRVPGKSGSHGGVAQLVRASGS